MEERIGSAVRRTLFRAETAHAPGVITRDEHPALMNRYGSLPEDPNPVFRRIFIVGMPPPPSAQDSAELAIPHGPEKANIETGTTPQAGGSGVQYAAGRNAGRTRASRTTGVYRAEPGRRVSLRTLKAFLRSIDGKSVGPLSQRNRLPVT
jgi:hypothetical protein